MTNSKSAIIAMAFLAVACQPNAQDTAAAEAEAEAAAVPTPAMTAAEATPASGPLSGDAAPAPPSWAVPLIGQPVATLFPNTIAKCLGSADKVAMRFSSPQPTVRIDGWAWNVTTKSTFDRLLAVNADGVVVGAGATVYERPDVLAVKADVVTELVSGYQVFAQNASGVVRIYGVDPGSAAVCRFSQITM